MTAANQKNQKKNLVCYQLAFITIVVLAFPVSAYCVFGLGVDRYLAADILASIYATGLYLVFFSAYLPLPGAGLLSSKARFHHTVMSWFWVSYLTHLSWELGWLVLHEWIIQGRNDPLAYTWWAYIDGGDYRYATANAELIMMEVLSVINGMLGITGLFLWFRRYHLRKVAVMLFMVTAVIHLYSTSLYYGSEIIGGFPNVNTESFYDVGVKFIIANSPWLVMPCLVLFWGVPKLLCPGESKHVP